MTVFSDVSFIDKRSDAYMARRAWRHRVRETLPVAGDVGGARHQPKRARSAGGGVQVDAIVALAAERGVSEADVVGAVAAALQESASETNPLPRGSALAVAHVLTRGLRRPRRGELQARPLDGAGAGYSGAAGLRPQCDPGPEPASPWGRTATAAIGLTPRIRRRATRRPRPTSLVALRRRAREACLRLDTSERKTRASARRERNTTAKCESIECIVPRRIGRQPRGETLDGPDFDDTRRQPDTTSGTAR
jgi:hypothetical protein